MIYRGLSVKPSSWSRCDFRGFDGIDGAGDFELSCRGRRSARVRKSFTCSSDASAMSKMASMPHRPAKDPHSTTIQVHTGKLGRKSPPVVPKMITPSASTVAAIRTTTTTRPKFLNALITLAPPASGNVILAAGSVNPARLTREAT